MSKIIAPARLRSGRGWRSSLAGWLALLLLGLPRLHAQTEPRDVDWRVVGVWPGHPRGAASVRLDGQTAYVAAYTGGLLIFDLRHPDHPLLVGHYSPALSLNLTVTNTPGATNPATANRLSSISLAEKAGNHVYTITGDNSVDVVEVSDPTRPRRVGGYRGGVDAAYADLKIDGTHAYVLDYADGLTVLDISNPQRVFETGRLRHPWTDFPWALAVTNGIAFVAAGKEGLVVVDAHPATPQIITNRVVNGRAVQSVGVAGLEAITVEVGDNFSGVRIYDVSQLPTLNRGRFYGLTNVFLPDTVRVGGDRLLVGGSGTGLYQWSSGNDPVSLASSPDSSAFSFDLAGNLIAALTYEDNLRLLEYTGAPDLVERGKFDLSGMAEDVAALGTTAFLADNLGGLRVLEVANSAQPQLLASIRRDDPSLDNTNPRLVRALGANRLAVASFDRLVLIDVSTPVSPRRLGSHGLDKRNIVDLEHRNDECYLVGWQSGATSARASFDALLLSPEGALTLRGSCSVDDLLGYSVGLAGDYALVGGVTNGLHIIRITDPSTPHVVGRYLPANRIPAVIQPIPDVTVRGTLGFLALGRDGIEVVDLQEPGQPRPLGRCRVPGVAYRVQVSGNRAYVACLDWGVQVVDVSDPRHPTLVGGIGTRGQARSAVPMGNRILVANGAYGLAVIEPDLETDRPPVIFRQPEGVVVPPGTLVRLEVGAGGPGPLTYQWRKNGTNLVQATNATLALPPMDPGVSGSYTVVVNSSGTGLGIESSPAWVMMQAASLPFRDDFPATNLVTGASGVGLTNNLLATIEPNEPRYAGKLGGRSLWLQWEAPATGVATFSTRGSGFDTLLGAFEGTSLTNLTELGSNDDADPFLTSEVRFNARAGQRYHLGIAGYGLMSSARDVRVEGAYAYVVGDGQGLTVYDIRAPFDPKPHGVWSAPWTGERIDIDGARAYVAAGPDGLRILDVSNPAAPVELGVYAIPDGTVGGVQADSTRALVAAGTNGLHVIDVTQPASPRRVGVLAATDSIRAVDFAGNLAYVLDGDELVVVDLSAPESPRRLRSFASDGNDVHLDGSFVVVATQTGLDVIDVSNPAGLALVGSYDGSSLPARAVTVAGSLAYLALGEGGLEVVDLQDPANPALVWRPKVGGVCYQVQPAGTVLYLANGDQGLAILDASRPERPVLVSGFRGGVGPILLSWSLETTPLHLPLITNQPGPAHQLVRLHASFALRVGAGPADCRYQWHLHGAPLAGETGPTLVRPFALPADAGTYFVRIVSPDGLALDSREVVVEVIDQPGGTTRGTVDKLADLFDPALFATVNSLVAAPRLGPPVPSEGRFTLYSDLRGSHRQPGEPVACIEGSGATRWYYFRSNRAGERNFATTNSSIKTLVAVFTNRAALKLAGCGWSGGPADATVSVSLQALQEAFVMVDGLEGQRGPIQLRAPVATQYLFDQPVPPRLEQNHLQFGLTLGQGHWEIFALEGLSLGASLTNLTVTNLQPVPFEFRDPQPATAPFRFFQLDWTPLSAPKNN